MKLNNKKWDKNFKEFKTRTNQMRFKEAKSFVENIEKDVNKDKRLDAQKCKICTYSNNMAFQAFTNTNCGYCDKEMTFSNSDIDTLCKRCATMLDACRCCGGEMD